MHRSVGGGWTEYIKSDLTLRQLATIHHASLLLPSVRTCPFCRLHHGTPRHYVMECPETALHSNEICDAVEFTLAGLGFPTELRDAGVEHYAKFPSPFLFDLPPSSSRRWPILSAWKWIVRNPLRENAFRSPLDGHSASIQEGAFDLAYRAVLPAALGYAIHRMDQPRIGVDPTEEEATICDSSLITMESERRSKLWKAQRPTTMVVTILALGLRKLRADLRQRVDAWKNIAVLEYPSVITILPTTVDDPLSPQEGSTHPRVVFQSSLSAWCNGSGSQFIRNLRWAMPSRDIAVLRFKAAAQFAFRVSDTKIISSLSDMGVPYVTDEGITWGQGRATWSDALQTMVTPCECSVPTLIESLGSLKRCVRCYGHIMVGSPDNPAMCGLCGFEANMVCVACSRGMHLEKTLMCQGANRAYLSVELDGHVVCPDCIWEWTKSLAVRDDAPTNSQQAVSRSIMNTAARLFDVRQPSLGRYIEDYVSHHSVTEEALVHVIESLDLSVTKKSGAAKAMRGLFHDGSLELRGGFCQCKVSNTTPSRRAMKRGRS